ncbi:Protein of unknown function (DUF668 [Striga hermonthica]|uniref:Uncharacterized protein n=1 Tax=Striga hermonthica TaxID=68872 RepID=A0A9N7MCX9_STRHE|nr:Protein of unknown function (DUF668 [Striga hermonthica]
MVAETWILRMGSQVSTNLKHALNLDSSTKLMKKQGPHEKQTLGILCFEVAKVMSKIMNLHKSLSDVEIFKLKNDILKSDGVKALVSGDEKQLLELALFEKLDDLNRIASVVSRLGKKCSIPALQGFEHVYGDIISGNIDVKELGFLVKDMEGMVRKMDKYVTHTAGLYRELEVLNELEQAAKKFAQNQHEETRKALQQKLVWQKNDVNQLKDVSLWNLTFDKVVGLLARTVCTVYARIHTVFGDGSSLGVSGLRLQASFGRSSRQKLRQLDVAGNSSSGYYYSGLIGDKGGGGVERKPGSFRPKFGLQKSGGGLFGPEDFNFACGLGPGHLFMECLSLSSSGSKVNYDDDDDDGETSVAYSLKSNRASLFDSFVTNVEKHGRNNLLKTGLLIFAPAHTVGGSALALHYANVIIIIEKLLRYPHLVGDEARDDLYQMLPTSLRKTLKVKLKSYVKDLAIFDAHLAHDWKERLDGLLGWLGPLAHNMIKWQTERNFEQQQIVARANVLLIQTLYFADREKTEGTICEILVAAHTYLHPQPISHLGPRPRPEPQPTPTHTCRRNLSTQHQIRLENMEEEDPDLNLDHRTEAIGATTRSRRRSAETPHQDLCYSQPQQTTKHYFEEGCDEIPRVTLHYPVMDDAVTA